MDLEILKQLQDLGYSKDQAEKIVTKDKVYFQSDVDNIVAKSVSGTKERYEKNFISKTDYDLLLSEHNNLKKEVKQSEVLNSFKKLSGNEKFFNDFIKIHPELLETETKDMDTVMKAKLSDSAWALSNEKPNLQDYGVSEKTSTDRNESDGTIYTKDWGAWLSPKK